MNTVCRRAVLTLLLAASISAQGILIPKHPEPDSDSLDQLDQEVGDELPPHTSLLQRNLNLQLKFQLAPLRTGPNAPANITDPLVFAHVPCNFGHSVELYALGQPDDIKAVYLSNLAPDYADQLWIMNNLAKAPDGVLWGMMHPAARPIDEATGCNLYYVPGYMWPQKAASLYFGEATPFGFLRDPYDKMVNEFRQQVQGIDSAYTFLTRAQVSFREGHMERENATYKQWYASCDVNAYLQAELGFYKQGGRQRFRDNCHLLPQVEFFIKQPHGAKVYVDVRTIPNSFDGVMEAHGYPYRMNMAIHNWMCNNISAYTLTEETKALIREVYAEDFKLICEQFGYCDDKEVTCLEQIPDMCGGKPGNPPPNSTTNDNLWWVKSMNTSGTNFTQLMIGLMDQYAWTGLNFTGWLDGLWTRFR